MIPLVVSLALVAGFVLLGDNTHLLGDGALRIVQMRQIGLGDAFRTIVPEPADYILHYAIDRYAAAPLGFGTLAVFRLLSYAAGLAFFWTAWAIARHLRSRGVSAGFTLCYLLGWGGSMMFFGYVEEYALAAAAMLFFFWIGLEFFAGRKGVLPLIAAFLACFFLHNFAIVLLPSLAYAVFVRRSGGFREPFAPRRDGPPVVSPGARADTTPDGGFEPAASPVGQPIARTWRAGALFLAAAVLVAGWIAVVIARRGAGTLLLPGSASEPGYSIWSPAHLADMANELFLVSPAFLVLLVLPVPAGPWP